MYIPLSFVENSAWQSFWYCFKKEEKNQQDAWLFIEPRINITLSNVSTLNGRELFTYTYTPTQYIVMPTKENNISIITVVMQIMKKKNKTFLVIWESQHKKCFILLQKYEVSFNIFTFSSVFICCWCCVDYLFIYGFYWIHFEYIA